MTEELFEAALGMSKPWYVSAVRFDAKERQLTIEVDLRVGSRFPDAEHPGEHPVHDTQTKRYRHLNFFQHECYLDVRVPRVKLPDGKVKLVAPAWEGRLKGFTLLFEALVMALCREMNFTAVSRITGLSQHRVQALCERYVDEAVARTDLGDVEEVAIDETRRKEQRSDPALKGMRWSLLKDRGKLDREAQRELDAFIAHATTKRTARAWLYKEQLRETLDRKQVHVVRAMLLHWCNCVMRSKVEPMKKVAAMIRRHIDGIVAWSRSRMTNGFLEAINGLFQSAKRKARGYSRFSTIRTVIFLIAGKLDFSTVNPHVQQPT